LHRPYNYKDTKLILREMADLLSLDLVDKRLVTDQIVLDIGYDVSNLTDPKIKRIYDGEITTDFYGRPVPKHAHGTINIDHKTSSTKIITDKILELYDRIIDFRLFVRRINICANKVVNEDTVEDNTPTIQQFDLFTDYESINKKIKEERKKEIKERELQHAMLDIKKKYGKNAILKGMNLEEAATTIQRNEGVGGHRG
jgi:DNA polymerase V